MKKAIYLSLFFIFMLMHEGIGAAEVRGPRNPNSAKGCAICHFRWIDTFFTEGRGTELVPYQAGKVAATPDMCFSCHDGSIQDSRARMLNGAGHKTDVPPPAGMKVPEIFPLDEAGKVQCATCHTAHGVDSDPRAKETIFMRTSNRDSAMCRMCHADKGVTAGAGTNHPVGPVEQETPDSLFSLGPSHLEDRKRLACETCHTAHGSMNEAFLVVTAGKSALCMACHRDKDPAAPAGREKRTHAVNVVPQQARIPREMIAAGARLDRGGEVICQTCHKVHNARPQQQLLLAGETGRAGLCLQCHTDKQSLAASNHNLMRSAPLEKNLRGETAAQAGVCSACHLAHQPAKKLAAGKDFSMQLCRECHRRGGVAKKSNVRFDTHPLGVDPFDQKNTHVSFAAREAGKGKMSLPLFNAFGSRDPGGSLSCATCHDPHGGPDKPPAQAAGKQGSAPAGSYFLRKPSPQICSECHDDKFFLTGSPHDLTRVTPEQNSVLNQRAQKSGLCGACHPVHAPVRAGGDPQGVSVEKGTTPQALCLECHTGGGIAEKRVDPLYSHPTDVSPEPQAADSGLPLFDPDGRKASGGVVKCYTCHDPHRARPAGAGAGPAAAEPEQGRATPSFLRAPSPQICEACHTSKRQVAGSRHDLTRVTAEQNPALQRRAAKYGLCGSCHPVHGSAEDVLGGGTAAGKEGDGPARGLCLSCHRENGLAAEKAIGGYSHPLKVSPIESGLQTTLPLFGRSGKQSRNGVMECYTCHDPHGAQRPAGTGAADDKALQTPAPLAASFLRKPALDICGDCHTDKLDVVNSKHDLAKTAPAEKNIRSQTAAESGPCGACHVVHNARSRSLWARDIQARSVKLSKEMCLGCHSEKGPAAKKALQGYSHPVNVVPVQKGAAAGLPLFDREGKKSEQGAVTCHTCHDPHRWDPSKKPEGAHFKTEGDARNSFLRRPNFPDSLLCESCHPDEALVKNSDHDLKVSAPDSKNIQGRTPAESGTCGVCHLVHNSKNWVRMWAQPIGRGDSVMEMLCNGCHSGGGSAPNKIPKTASHPPIKFTGAKKEDKGRRPGYFPVFHRHYAEQISAGYISCAYCHNAHQWDPKVKEPGPGAKVEGDATNSFLRAPSRLMGCQDCHGPDALFRIKNFHLPEKRKPAKSVGGR